MADLLIEFVRPFKPHFPDVAAGIFVFLVFVIGAMMAKKSILRISNLKEIDRDVANFIAKFAKASLLIIGGITALETAKMDVSPLVAALGLTGFALGFALKDLISNLLSGILILIHRPFKRDDRIAVDKFEGVVTEIDLRYTTLEAGDKKYLVPNAILFSKGITVMRSSNDSGNST